MSTQSHDNVRLHEMLQYVREGRLLDAMKEFYADNVVMEEPAYGATKGLDANLKREQHFAESVKEFRNFQVPHVAVGQNTGMYENVMDWIGQDGREYHVEQVSVQTWKNGKIIHERFYYNA